MKKNVLILFSFLLISACGEGEKPEDSESNSPTALAWEGKYRCPVPIDQSIRYTDEEGYNSLADSSLAVAIFDAVKKGDLQVYDNEMNPLNADEARWILKYIKSTTVEDDEGNYVEILDTMNVAPHHVVEILAREDWVLEKGTYALRKNVKAYAPVINTFDHEGEVRGKKILFWVKNPE